MTHVAIVTTSYPDGMSGQEAAGSFVEDFALELSRHVRVTVIAASKRQSTSVEGNLTVQRFAVARLPLSQLKPQNPADWLPIARTLKSGQQALASLALEARPDHIFALWALPAGFWARKVADQYSIPFSIWALGSDIWSLGKIPIVRGILRGVLRRAETCFADGLKLARDVEALANVSCGFLPSTRKLPSPVESSTNQAGPYKLAFLGRWHPNKGVDLLLEAIEKLSDEDWQNIIEIRINGGGPMEALVTSAISKLQSQGRPVEQGGYLGRQAAADLIGWADYLLLPSRIESIPVIFSDAVQLNTPLVATPIGDLPRLYEKYEFGILANATSADAYAGAISSALSVPIAGFQQGLDDARSDFDLGSIARQFLDETGLLKQ